MKDAIISTILAGAIALTGTGTSLFFTFDHANPDTGATETEALKIERTLNKVSTSKKASVNDLNIKSDEIVDTNDGVVTTVVTDPEELASITIDDEVTVGVSIARVQDVERGVTTYNGTTIFPIKASDDAYVFQILDGGSINASGIMTSPDSSRTFTYDMSREITPVVQHTGAVGLYDHELLVGIVELSEAYDALGNEVPASYSVVNGDLLLTTTPNDDVIYPVVATASIGAFLTKGDYVHVTGGEASGHGWWIKGTTSATTAKVTVQLQYKSSASASWSNRGNAGVRTIKPGTSKRANARVKCQSTGTKQWRSWVDVDLVGYLDTPNKYYTAAQAIKCTP